MSFSAAAEVGDPISPQGAPAPLHVENTLWKLAKKIINFIVNIFLGIFSSNSTPILASPTPILASPAPILALPAPILASHSPILASHSPILASHSPILASHSPILASPAPILASPYRHISSKIQDILDTHQYGDGSPGCCGLLQLQSFARAKKYNDIRSHHYDWWMFPIDSARSKGERFELSNDHFRELATNHQAFMRNYKEGIKIVLEAWGWDLDSQTDISSRPSNKGWFGSLHQRWDGYGIRLVKMANSLQLFIDNSSGDQQRELQEVYKSVRQFYKAVVLPKHHSREVVCRDFSLVTHYCKN